jgi:hypothetical protein
MRLLPRTCPCLSRCRSCSLPGSCVPAVAELRPAGLTRIKLSLTRHPAGSLLGPGGRPGARVAAAAARSGYPALSLPSGPPGSRVPRVGAESRTRRLPAAGRARAGTVRCLVRGPVRPLRRPGGLPRPSVRVQWPLARRPAGSLLGPGGLPRPGVPRVLAELPGRLRTTVLPCPERTRASVRSGSIAVVGAVRRLTGCLTVVPGHGRPALAERFPASWPRSLPRPVRGRPVRAWSWLPASELASPVSGWSLTWAPLPRTFLPVCRLFVRPRLPLAVSTLPWSWP